MGEGREGKGMGAKLLFMTARNEQLHHTRLAFIGLEGLIIQTFWGFPSIIVCVLALMS